MLVKNNTPRQRLKLLLSSVALRPRTSLALTLVEPMITSVLRRSLPSRTAPLSPSSTMQSRCGMRPAVQAPAPEVPAQEGLARAGPRASPLRASPPRATSHPRESGLARSVPTARTRRARARWATGSRSAGRGSTRSVTHAGRARPASATRAAAVATAEVSAPRRPQPPTTTTTRGALLL